MILSTEIQNNIEKLRGCSLYPDYDVRYLNRWIEEYPSCFPNYIKENRYNTIFNWQTLEYEIYEKD